MDKTDSVQTLKSQPLYGSAAGEAFRERLCRGNLLQLCGIHDAFSALIAAKRFEGVFCSGFGFAASQYGLPDIGYVSWRDIHDFATRIRHVLPYSHLLVDVDDGYGDEVISANTISTLESSGVSAVMMEDQQRPRRCGHFGEKLVLPADQFSIKLRRALSARNSMVIIARTDATDMEDALQRVIRYARDGADGIMIEAVPDLGFVRRVVRETGVPVMVNQLYGGKSPEWTISELQNAGVSIVIYSTPCLFSAQYAMEQYLDAMVASGRLPVAKTSTMEECVNILHTPPWYGEDPGSDD